MVMNLRGLNLNGDEPEGAEPEGLKWPAFPDRKKQ